MSREIKFRAWSDNKVMMYDIQDSRTRSNSDWEIVSFSDWLYNHRHKLMQYTGLKDKNDKEIYEGDILSLKSKKSVWVCVYESYRFRFVPHNPGLNYLKPDNWCQVLEIIGTIYENPELLGESK